MTLPLLANFGLEDGLELKITRRGAPPLGGGIVFQKKNVNFILNIFFFSKRSCWIQMSYCKNIECSNDVGRRRNSSYSWHCVSIHRKSWKKCNLLILQHEIDLPHVCRRRRVNVLLVRRATCWIESWPMCLFTLTTTKVRNVVFCYIEWYIMNKCFVFVGKEAGLSPGFGVSLVCESTT